MLLLIPRDRRCVNRTIGYIVRNLDTQPQGRSRKEGAYSKLGKDGVVADYLVGLDQVLHY